MFKKQFASITSTVGRAVLQSQNVIIALLAIFITVEVLLIVYRKYQRAVIVTKISAHKKRELKLDVNSASAAQLECVPGITKRLAEKIVKYRREYIKRFPTQKAFNKPDDLLKIKGIGPKTLLRIKKYLKFSSAKH